MAQKTPKPRKDFEKPRETQPEAQPFELKELHLWILTILAFIGFYWYSTKSVGYYQDDELAHFISMRGFWEDPTSIMGNWSKPGYKLLYVLPAKLGYDFVILINCLVSALGCWLAAKTAQHFNKSAAGMAFILAAMQPVWIELSFRNYADILSGVLLIASVYFALKEKWLVSSLFLSYNILVRQEFLILLLILGVYLLIKRKWVPMLALGIFPLAYALWTLQAKGDFFYMITEAQATSAAYAKEYPKQGLWHYPSLVAVLFGAMQVALITVAIYQLIMLCMEKEWIKMKGKDSQVLLVFIPFLVFFGIHCIFNMKSPEIGPATGGNMRYMTAISPLAGVIAALSLFWFKRPQSTVLYLILVVMGLVVLSFMCFDHNYVTFKREVMQNGEEGDKIRDWFPFLIFVAGAALYFIPLKGWALMGYTAVCGFIFLSKEVHPYQLSPENMAVQQCVQKLTKDDKLKDNMVLSNHPAVWFYWLKETNENKKNAGSLDSTSIDKAPAGTICLWDYHYGYKPNRTPGSVLPPQQGQGIPPYFANENYKSLEQFRITSKDQRFQIMALQKLK